MPLDREAAIQLDESSLYSFRNGPPPKVIEARKMSEGYNVLFVNLRIHFHLESGNPAPDRGELLTLRGPSGILLSDPLVDIRIRGDVCPTTSLQRFPTHEVPFSRLEGPRQKPYLSCLLSGK